MHAHGFGDLIADAQNRIERGHRLLKNHRQPAVTGFDALPGLQLRHVGAVEQDTPGPDPRARARQQSHRRKRGHALAAAGFADEAENFAACSISNVTRRRRCRPVLTREPDRDSKIANSEHVSPRRQRHVAESRVEAIAQRVADEVQRKCRQPRSSLPGKNSSHGARVMKVRDSASMLPQLGMSGGAPSPRKVQRSRAELRERKDEAGLHQQRRDQVRQDVLARSARASALPCCAPPRHRFRRASAR